MKDTPPDTMESPPGRGRSFHVSWYLLLALGWLIWEYTSQPGLAAGVTCAKFGWSDLRAALWLRRVDPEWRRGRTCFWFYLAFALWKVALMATLVMIVMLLIVAAGQPKQAGPPRNGLSPAVVGVLVAAGTGFGLSFLITYVSIASALRNRVKVWLGSAPHRARVSRYWPPQYGQHNAAPFLTITTLILTLWFLVLGIALAGIQFGFGAVGVVLLMLLALASPLTMLVLKYLERRVFARSPEECWPPDEVGLLRQADEMEPAFDG